MNYSTHATSVMIALMLAQCVFGLARPELYRDTQWIKAAWFGNDWVTLGVAVPLLWVARRTAAKGSVRGLLLWVGTLTYAVYNYTFYLFGAALNAFFPIYVLLVVFAIGTLIVLLSRIDAASIAATFRPELRVRVAAGYLVVVAAGLSMVWLVLWAAHVFADRPTPVEPGAFKVVAAVDLTLLVPTLMLGGIHLWRRTAWGFVTATAASIAGTLYLLVLGVNSAIALQRGLAPSPGELPLWARSQC